VAAVAGCGAAAAGDTLEVLAVLAWAEAAGVSRGLEQPETIIKAKRHERAIHFADTTG